MRKGAWFSLSGTLLAIGSAILALTSIPEVAGRAELHRILEITGAVLVVVGIFGFALPFVPRPPETDYDHRRAKRNDLKEIFKLCDQLFDGQVSSLNLMKKWFRHNGDIFWVVEKARQKRGFKETRLVGYFSIIPLTQTAKEKVLAGELPGTHFSLEHIARMPEAAEAFYIGGVGANEWRARGHTLTYLKAHVQILGQQRGLPFLTRPITADGLRLAKKYEFDAVHGEGIGKVYTLTKEWE